MDHIKVLKRAWHMVWRYRALWIFGIVLALTTASWGERAVLYRDRGDVGDRLALKIEPTEDIQKEIEQLSRLFTEGIPSDVTRTIIAIGIGLACLIAILFIASKIARYVAETALIRMVDDYEQMGKQQNVRRGFRMGWSRTAWRLFLIDLLIDLPAALAFLLLFALVLSPLLLWTAGSTAAGVVGTVASIGLLLLLVFLAIIVAAVLSLLKRFFRRACALDELAVTESIRQGYAIVRHHLKDAGLMWVIMVGVRLGWMIAMIPVTILLVVVGGVLGGLSALLVGALSQSVLGGATPWILAGAVGIPAFILALVAPLTFLGGLREVFLSSTWTLTYRELHALENLKPERLPEVDASGPEVAPVAS